MGPVKFSFGNFTFKYLDEMRRIKLMVCFSQTIIFNGVFMIGNIYLSIYQSFKAAIQQLTIATFTIDFNTGVGKDLQSVLLY